MIEVFDLRFAAKNSCLYFSITSALYIILAILLDYSGDFAYVININAYEQGISRLS